MAVEVDQLLNDIAERAGNIFQTLQQRTADVEPAVNRLWTVLGGLQSTSSELSKGGLSQISSAFKQLDRSGATAENITNLAKALALADAKAQEYAAKELARAAKKEREDTAKSPLGGLILGLNDFSAALGRIRVTVDQFGGGLGKVISPLLAAGQAVSNFYEGLARQASRNLQGFSGAAGVASGLTSGILGPLNQLAGAVAPFVQALNPGLMKVFNQALRDLMATFGVAFAPVIQHVAALFNELSATLAPAMRALAPILDALMSVLEGALVPVIGMIADAFVALAPIIEFVASIMASISEAMRVFYTVLRSALQVVWDIFRQFAGGVDLKGAAESIRNVIQQLTKYFVQFAAYVAKALGYLDPFAAALKKNLEDLKGQKPGQKAAPENIHITGLEQISKDLAVAAFAAQQAAPTQKKSEAEFLEELIKSVEEVQRNGKTLQQFLKEKLDELARLLGFTAWQKFQEWLGVHVPLWLTGNMELSQRTMALDRQVAERQQKLRERWGDELLDGPRR